MPTYEYECDSCGSTTDHFCSIDDRPDTLSCVCGSVAIRIVSSPMIMRESYPDGTRRPGWDRMREAVQLKRESAVSRSSSTRREIEGEIRKLGVRVGRDPT